MKLLWFFGVNAYIFHIIAGNDESNEYTGAEKKIKGQKFIHQTMSAKVIDGEVPKDVILALLPDTDHHQSMITSQTGNTEDISKPTPKLLAENVKTTVTRFTIPLSTTHLKNEWYRAALKKFLSQNRISLFNSTEEQGQQVTAELVEEKLLLAVKFRNSLLNLFRYLLFGGKPLGKDYYEALQLIYEHLVTNRIHALDMVQYGQLHEIPLKPIKEQLLHLFELIERFAPMHLKSCVTYWLQGIQEEEAICFSNETGANDQLDVLSGVKISSFSTLELNFPAEILQKTHYADVQFLGSTLAYTVITLGNYLMPLRDTMIGLIFTLLPVQFPNLQIDNVKWLNQHKINDDQCFQNFSSIDTAWNLVLQQSIECLGKRATNEIKFKLLMTSYLEQSALAATSSTFNYVQPKNASVLFDLLNEISVQEFGSEVFKIKNNLSRNLNRFLISEIKINYANYKSRTQFVFNLLTQILNTFNFPREIVDDIETFKMYLHFHLVVKQRGSVTPTDVAGILLSFDTYMFNENIRNSARLLSREILKGCMTSNYFPQSRENCNRPRLCIRLILIELQRYNKRNNINIVCQSAIREFLWITAKSDAN